MKVVITTIALTGKEISEHELKTTFGKLRNVGVPRKNDTSHPLHNWYFGSSESFRTVIRDVLNSPNKLVQTLYRAENYEIITVDDKHLAKINDDVNIYMADDGKHIAEMVINKDAAGLKQFEKENISGWENF